MMSYSWLQKILHRFVLSYQFIREVTFDVESSFVSNTKDEGNHVFIAGLARSGSTVLLNSIYDSDEFASLSYADMPFVLAPNFWLKMSFKKSHTAPVERAHGDGIRVSTESPEAFEEVFWMTFEDTKSESYLKFKDYIKLIMSRCNKNRYLSKNNNNIRRLGIIEAIFPNATILIPFRNPIQHANSLFLQHKKFIKEGKRDRFISRYMRWIGHTEFGPSYEPIHCDGIFHTDDLQFNHWLEQWYLTYSECLQLYSREKHFHFVCYESLCQSDRVWDQVIKLLDIKKTYSASFQESFKEVFVDIDPELNLKCDLIYRDLKSISLKN